MAYIIIAIWMIASNVLAETITVEYRSGYGICETNEDGSASTCSLEMSKLKAKNLTLKPDQWSCSPESDSARKIKPIYGACFIEEVKVEKKNFINIFSISRSYDSDQVFYDFSIQTGSDKQGLSSLDTYTHSPENLPPLQLRSSTSPITSRKYAYSFISIEETRAAQN